MPVKRTRSAALGGSRAAVAALLVVLGLGWRAGAQEAAPTTSSAAASRGPNEFGVWGGGSVGSATMIGRWTDFNFGMLALRYARNLWRNDAFALDWTVDGVPLALIALDRGGQPKQSNGPKE